MSDSSWNRVKEVFQAALDREPPERVGFVLRACGDDRRLRAEVESLLAALEQAGTFVEQPAIQSFAPSVLLATNHTLNAGSRALRRGDVLGPHKILDFVGAGGMGEVYRAHDERLDRDVAIKVLPDSDASDSIARRQLLQEARAAATLNHANVCTVHEIGEVDGRVFIVMEFIEGRPLDDWIPAGGVQTDETVRYGLQIADAIAHAHERGIVHGDLKTSNVMITPLGLVKVLDFGLAMRLNANHLTVTTIPTDGAGIEMGVLRGTLPYMAPELLRGERADAASDVWALGVILYEMATGARPFMGATASDIRSAIMHETPARFPSRFSGRVASVIERCLHKMPRERFCQAGEVRTALEAVRTDPLAAATASVSKFARRRIAVLPLQNLGDAEHQPLVDGFHEALITDLAGLRALRVVARSSVMRFKNREVTISKIAEQLRVDTILTGSVVRAGDRVRVTAQLVDSASEEHLWAARYEGHLGDALALQSDIVTAIVRAIELQLTSTEEQARISHRRPVNPEAYEAYLKGRFHWYKISREYYNTALKYFQLALEKDPTWAPAYAGIANIWLMRGDSGIIPALDALPKLNEALSKALALDPELAEVHEIAGNGKFLYEWDWAGAESEFRTAIRLNPNHADARLFLSDLLISTKRFGEARAEMERALDLDPLSSFLRCFNGWQFVYLGRCDDAIAELEMVLKAEPTFSSGHLGLWGAWYRKQMFREALTHAKSFFAAIGDSEIERALGDTHTDRGYVEPMMCAARALEARARQTYVPAIRIARLYAHASDADRACEWLERAYERRETPLIHLAVGWDWDGLREDPRFDRLIRRMNLPPYESDQKRG